MAQPQSGALRPSIIIGLGTFGRLALQELRCRFIDRFGDSSKAPIIRFLYVDSDGEAIQQSVRGSSETALPRSETYHLPIQAASRYRRRSLDQLSDWLPREKLHSIPRSLQAQGSAAHWAGWPLSTIIFVFSRGCVAKCKAPRTPTRSIKP